MSFIGIIASRKCFETIKKKIIEEIKDETVQLIQINLRSIENIKNIKFETIVIEDNLTKFKGHKEILSKILKNTRYIMINTDKNPDYEEENAIQNSITYGLNQKAMVTVSSISETNILVYWQSTLQNREGKTLEIEERRVKKEKEYPLKTYEILIIYTLLKIYSKKHN